MKTLMNESSFRAGESPPLAANTYNENEDWRLAIGAGEREANGTKRKASKEGLRLRR